MNILISLDFTLYEIVKKNWPKAFIQEVNSFDGVFRSIFNLKYELLILDVDMPGNEKLAIFISKAVFFCKVAVFSSKNNIAAINRMMVAGAHVFLPSKLSSKEITNILNELQNS
ncbi:hypothetical protein [Pedobacter sp. Hv1]|uniref:hypothetical protein n=1 Tax=Pedobacter sp. Hv1 TaxID=1740090 RepID=UPI0006D8A609|nr:hypothetical protein [Pedobacter sp. Hv1]KQC01167.1 hypothetical protein AQF98_10925 [Pedobacter sp. Hv1]